MLLVGTFILFYLNDGKHKVIQVNEDVLWNIFSEVICEFYVCGNHDREKEYRTRRQPDENILTTELSDRLLAVKVSQFLFYIFLYN